MTPGADRALQDALIRLLADAPFRNAVGSLADGASYGALSAEQVTMLRAATPERVSRFARFLARQFYHERVAHFYKYSRALARFTDRWPEHALRGAAFEALLPSVVLGSRDTARALAHIVEQHLADAPHAPPYAAELARYESAQLVVESGPRVWHSNEEPPALTRESRLAPSEHAVLLRLEWDLPAVLPALLAFEQSAGAPPRPPDAPRRPTTLLIARAPRGRVTVLQWSTALETFAAQLGASRPIAAAARAADIDETEGVEIATMLREAGALTDHFGLFR